MIHSVGKQKIIDEINSKSAMNYAQKFVEWVNKEEAKVDKKTNTQERNDKSVIHHPKEFKEKQS